MARRFVGVREIAKLLGTSRQRADQLARTKTFPDPIVELASGRIWARSDVVHWAKSDGRSVPWATVELELEQLPEGPAGSAANIYRMVWETGRMKALSRNPTDGPRTREEAHCHALASARQTDPGFDTHMPAEVDDEADETPDPTRAIVNRDRWVRTGDDSRGYWLLEWQRHWNGSYAWWLWQYFVAEGIGWNVRDHPKLLGHCTPGTALEPFLRDELTEADTPTDVGERLVNLVLDHGPR